MDYLNRKIRETKFLTTVHPQDNFLYPVKLFTAYDSKYSIPLGMLISLSGMELSSLKICAQKTNFKTLGLKFSNEIGDLLAADSTYRFSDIARMESVGEAADVSTIFRLESSIPFKR